MNETTIPPRPKRSDKSVLDKIAEKLLPGVIQWIGPDEGTTEKYKKEIQDHIVDAISASIELDGYKLAKQLDNIHGYDADVALVEAMDGASDFSFQIIEEESKKWVISNNLKCPYEVGDTVLFRNNLFSPYKTGKIVDINNATLRLTINSPELGHRPIDSKVPGTRGVIINFENCKPVTSQDTGPTEL